MKRIVIGTVLSGLMATSVLAARTWNNTLGDWSVAANWLDSAPPVSGDGQYVYIMNAGTAQVTTSETTGGRLYVGGQAAGLSGTLDVDGGALNVEGYALFVGRLGSIGTVNVENGGNVTSARGVLGSNVDGTGTVTVDGSNSTWTVTESGSYDFILGDGSGSSGTVNVLNGGALTNPGWSRVGYQAGATGQLIVSGSGAAWTPGLGVNIGNNSGSTGTLTVADGGIVTPGGVIAVGYNGTGTLNVNGGIVNSPGYDFYIGQQASSSGTLNITTGGVVVTKSSNIGPGSDASGSVIVSGTGSVWTNSGSLFVGRFGSGTLTITSGGLVSVANALFIDEKTNGVSFVNISDGRLEIGGFAESENLAGFLDLVGGTDEIRYWDAEDSAWSHIANGVAGVDYDVASEIEGGSSNMVLTVYEPSSVKVIDGLEYVSTDVVKMVIDYCPNLAGSYPKKSTDLVFGGWGGVPHSTNGVAGTFVTTNLSYSVYTGSNRVIYLEAADPAAFFGIGGE